MKVVYACYGGAHSSAVAAWIHLGKLPVDRVPGADDILCVPKYDRTVPSDLGKARCVGRDELGNDVYVLGRGPCSRLVERAFVSGFCTAGGKSDDLMIVDTLTCVNMSMRVGGFFSRRLGWAWIGRPIVLWGTRRAYPRLVRIVRETKARLAEREGGGGTELGVVHPEPARPEGRSAELLPEQGNPS